MSITLIAGIASLAFTVGKAIYELYVGGAPDFASLGTDFTNLLISIGLIHSSAKTSAVEAAAVKTAQDISTIVAAATAADNTPVAKATAVAATVKTP